MKKGPILNNNTRNFTTRDSLGIESVAASISRELCPIVNTVTPRAFYWAFMTWIYYDFYKYSGIEEHTTDVFNKQYVKRQDYFFVLSQLLNNAPDQYNLVGKQNSELDILHNKTDIFSYNPDYFVSRFGGMQYYNAGCITLDFIREVDTESGQNYKFPKLTKAGEKMALAFKSCIQDTEYYKNFRLNDIPVPKDVLIEYGKAINLSLEGFGECKEYLRQYLFEVETPNNYYLKDSSEYLKLIFEKYDMDGATLASYRDILFDAFSIRGRNEEISSEYRYVINGWEIVIGRQYFTSGLEMIWKYMLEQIYSHKTKEKWIKDSIESTEWTFDISHNKLESIIVEAYYDFDVREDMIYEAAHSINPEKMIENGLRIVLSIYNRFINRDDFGEEKEYLNAGYESYSISLNELIETVNKYKERPVKEFIIFIMDNWLIEQHYNTAFEKMIEGRDGFYYDINDGKYSFKHDFSIDFQGIRLFQLAQVMKDLDIL